MSYYTELFQNMFQRKKYRERERERENLDCTKKIGDDGYIAALSFLAPPHQFFHPRQHAPKEEASPVSFTESSTCNAICVLCRDLWRVLVWVGIQWHPAMQTCHRSRNCVDVVCCPTRCPSSTSTLNAPAIRLPEESTAPAWSKKTDQ